MGQSRSSALPHHGRAALLRRPNFNPWPCECRTRRNPAKSSMFCANLQALEKHPLAENSPQRKKPKETPKEEKN
jgi:hypothetical protein